VKASFSENEKKTIAEAKSRLFFVSNGGDPGAAKIISEFGDRGADSKSFSVAFERWLDTIEDKPQIANFKLRSILEVCVASQSSSCYSLIHSVSKVFFLILLGFAFSQLIPVEEGPEYVDIRRNLMIVSTLYDQGVNVARRG
jgi:hypothetical protein